MTNRHEDVSKKIEEVREKAREKAERIKSSSKHLPISIWLLLLPIMFMFAQYKNDYREKRRNDIDNIGISILKRNLKECYKELEINNQAPNLNPENSSHQNKRIFANELRECEEKFKNKKGIDFNKRKKKSRPMTPEDWERVHEKIKQLNDSNIKLK